MQRNPASQVFQPVAAEERVFSENFIQHQLNIVTTASQKILLSGLLEERKITAIINYMRDLWLTIDTGRITGKTENTRSLNELISLVDLAIQRFTRHYQLPGTHPLLPVMSKIKKNIIDYLTMTHPEFVASLPASQDEIKNEGDTSDTFDVKPVAILQVPDRVFPDIFIARQLSLIVTASEKVTEEGILEKESVKILLDYMQDLEIDKQQNVMSGNKLKERNYDGLLTIINDFYAKLKNTQWSKKHPLLPVLTAIKNNIEAWIALTQASFSQNLQHNLGENKASIAGARCNIVKDTCGILACLAWVIPEKIITLDNGCETLCGPSDACCPEPILPKQNVYCNLWAPKESIRALHDDAKEQSETINQLKSAPIRQTMA
ncbi:MAG: hypothetical protein P4M12_08025 [Gammaproteobacteria bacterium]|nr:hypothetical protein [Gammaproteobacteria bacterium]